MIVTVPSIGLGLVLRTSTLLETVDSSALRAPRTYISAEAVGMGSNLQDLSGDDVKRRLGACVASNQDGFFHSPTILPADLLQGVGGDM